MNDNNEEKRTLILNIFLVKFNNRSITSLEKNNLSLSIIQIILFSRQLKSFFVTYIDSIYSELHVCFAISICY